MSYDIKFRQRAIAYMNDGHTQKETATTFKVSTFTLWKWKSQLNETGNLSPKKRKESWKKINPEKLRTYIAENPDAYQRELAEAFGVSLRAIQKALMRLAITRKKNHSIQGN